VDVHILHDGVSIFNSNVTGSPSPTSYSGLQGIVAGDTIDFAVGVGSDGNYNEDLTALSATIVPEPDTLGLVGMGFGCLLSFRFLKRK
jgi:PEP-CTERM motif